MELESPGSGAASQNVNESGLGGERDYLRASNDLLSPQNRANPGRHTGR